MLKIWIRWLKCATSTCSLVYNCTLHKSKQIWHTSTSFLKLKNNWFAWKTSWLFTSSLLASLFKSIFAYSRKRNEENHHEQDTCKWIYRYLLGLTLGLSRSGLCLFRFLLCFLMFYLWSRSESVWRIFVHFWFIQRTR